jgi:ech hydrogenase subunit F
MYPAVPREFPEKARGHIEINIDKCIFCGLCSRRCPAQALKVSKEQKSWEIDRARCVLCNFCVEICPVKCLRCEKQYASSYLVQTNAVFFATSQTTKSLPKLA